MSRYVSMFLPSVLFVLSLQFLTPVRGQSTIDSIHGPGYAPDRIIGAPLPVNAVPESSDVSLLAYWPFGSIDKVVASGNYAYITNGSALQVLDVTDPSDITSVAYLDLRSYSITDLHLEGGILYALTSGYVDPLLLIDVSDPTDPFITATVEHQESWSGFLHVKVSGNYAYLSHYNGLAIIDVTDPTAPEIAGDYSADFIEFLSVAGSLVYVDKYDSDTLRVLDVSDPAAPEIAGKYYFPYTTAGMVSYGDYVYISESDHKVRIIDAADPAAMAQVDSISLNGIQPQSMEVSGSYLYTDGPYSGLLVYDLANPAAPAIVDTCLIGGNFSDLAVSGSRAYLADSDNDRLVAVDISTPAALTQTGEYLTPGSVSDVRAAGDYAYVGTDNGLLIFDVSDSTNPVEVGNFNPNPSGVWGVSCIHPAGDLVYTGFGNNLYVVDVSVPTAPAAVGSLSVNGGVYAIDTFGLYAYIASGTNGLTIVDITNSTAPSQVAIRNTPGYAFDVQYFGPYVYVADQTSVKIIDVTDPSAPVDAGSYITSGSALNLHYSGSYLYVADSNRGMAVLDVSDPASPTLAGTYDTDYYAYDVFVSGGIAYLANADGGLRVLDASIPSDIRDLGKYQMGPSNYTVDVVDGLIYSGNGECGFSILKYSDAAPAAPTDLAAGRNSGEIVLSWTAYEPLDFSYYKIYRNTSGTFTSTDSVGVSETADWTDSGLIDGTVYYYAVSTVDLSGNESALTDAVDVTFATGIGKNAALPAKFSLSQNFPNPFNPETTIRFALPEDCTVNLRVYNITGQTVRSLKQERMAAGYHQVRWDGSDNAGRGVGSGVYFYRIEAGEFRQVRRMVLLK